MCRIGCSEVVRTAESSMRAETDLFPPPFECFSSVSWLFPGVCIPDFDCLIYGLDVGDVGVEVVRVVPIQATRVG